MLLHYVALIAIATGVIALVVGFYGVIGPGAPSVFLDGFGLVVLLGGTGLLLFAARPWRLSWPHPSVIAIVAVAAGLHAYENLYRATATWIGLLIWSMVPYGLCLVLSAFSATRLPVLAGAILALAFDLWGHHSVFVQPRGSTAALALLWFPLWNTIILVPLGTFLAWSLRQWRKRAPEHAA